MDFSTSTDEYQLDVNGVEDDVVQSRMMSRRQNDGQFIVDKTASEFIIHLVHLQVQLQIHNLDNRWRFRNSF